MNKYEEAKPDMLGSFLKRGLSPDQAEMEISITLYEATLHPSQEYFFRMIVY